MTLVTADGSLQCIQASSAHAYHTCGEEHNTLNLSEIAYHTCGEEHNTLNLSEIAYRTCGEEHNTLNLSEILAAWRLCELAVKTDGGCAKDQMRRSCATFATNGSLWMMLNKMLQLHGGGHVLCLCSRFCIPSMSCVSPRVGCTNPTLPVFPG